MAVSRSGQALYRTARVSRPFCRAFELRQVELRRSGDRVRHNRERGWTGERVGTASSCMSWPGSVPALCTRTDPAGLGRCFVALLVRNVRVGHGADESVGKPDSVAHRNGEGRSSICDRCCQRPGAIYPEARASSPQAPPQTRVRVLLILLRVGFAEPPQSPGVLVVSYTTVSPLPPKRRSVLCGTFPRVTPGGRYPPPCSVESGLSSTHLERRAAIA